LRPNTVFSETAGKQLNRRTLESTRIFRPDYFENSSNEDWEIDWRKYGCPNCSYRDSTHRLNGFAGRLGATWMVTFELEGTEMIRTVISVPIKGPPSHQEAQQQALKQLQVFLIEGGEAAKNFQI
jgi:hypothetical protein